MAELMVLERVVVPPLVTFLLVASVATPALGWALVFRAPRALAIMRSLTRWVSTRRALRPIEIPRSVGGELTSGRRKLLAAFLLLGGLFALYMLVFRITIPRAALVLGVNVQRWFIIGVVLQTMKWFLIVGSLLAVFVGVLVLFFPTTLAAFEARMNRWYSTRHLLPREGENMKYPLDMLVEAYPNAAGWTIAAASALVAMMMAGLVFARLLG